MWVCYVGLLWVDDVHRTHNCCCSSSVDCVFFFTPFFLLMLLLLLLLSSYLIRFVPLYVRMFVFMLFLCRIFLLFVFHIYYSRGTFSSDPNNDAYSHCDIQQFDNWHSQSQETRQQQTEQQTPTSTFNLSEIWVLSSELSHRIDSFKHCANVNPHYSTLHRIQLFWCIFYYLNRIEFQLRFLCLRVYDYISIQQITNNDWISVNQTLT